jgi:hypothetical protein
MHAIWKDDPVEFQGKRFKIAKSTIRPKPLQKPHPPVIMAAYAPAALKRVATLSDGWHPVGLPLPAMKQMWESVQEMAREAGRDPSQLQLVVRANFTITPEQQDENRMIFTGSEDQIRQDTEGVRDLGADEVIFDPTTGPNGDTIDSWLESMERIRELAGAAVGARA